MPIPIRRFHIQKINEYVRKQEEEQQAQSSSQELSKENNPMKKIVDLQNKAKSNKTSKPSEYSTSIKPKK